MNDFWKAYDSSSEEALERYNRSYEKAKRMTDYELLDLWDCFNMQTIEQAMLELDCASREDLLHEAALKISCDDSYEPEPEFYHYYV